MFYAADSILSIFIRVQAFFPALHEQIRQDAFDFIHERNAVNFLEFLSCLDFSTLLWKRISVAGNVLLYLLSPMLDMLVRCSTPPLTLRTFNATR